LRPSLRSALKFAISLALVAYLIWSLWVNDPETFERLGAEPIKWPRLVLALLLMIVEAIAVGTRWWIGLRTLGLQHRFAPVLRLSLVAYALNFVGLGVVGGDVIKGLLLSGSQRGRVMISVLVDRLIGLECVLLFAGGASLLKGFDAFPPAFAAWLRVVIVIAAAGLVMGPLLLFSGRGVRMLAALPLPQPLGRGLASLDGVVRLYRRNWLLLVAAAGATGFILCTQILAFFLISTSLPGPSPTVGEQALIIPLAILGTVVPMPASGLGVLDWAVSFLYGMVTNGRVASAQGLLAMMLSRLLSTTIAGTGLWLYLKRREAVNEALRGYQS
jgi:uncharacterized membrane protein YbhN (UPF0104 family)